MSHSRGLHRRLTRLEAGTPRSPTRRAILTQLAQVQVQIGRLVDQATPLEGQDLVAASFRLFHLEERQLKLIKAAKTPAERAEEARWRGALEGGPEPLSMSSELYQPFQSNELCELVERAVKAMTPAQLDEFFALMCAERS